MKDDKWVFNDDVNVQFGGEGVERRILAYTDELMCVENTFEKGAEGAMHHHPHTQISYVRSGVFEFYIEDEARVIKPGDTVLVKGGIPHGCKCLKAGKLLDIFTPMREDFI